MPDDTKRFYGLMSKPYEASSDDEKAYWNWTMVNLLPIVSKEWNDRLKGKKALVTDVETGQEHEEELGHYLSCSDFAYVPLVVQIYGDRELKRKEDEEKTKGRTAGQAGMTSRESIAKYVESVLAMKAVLDDENNKKNIKDWGNAVFTYIDSLDEDFSTKATAGPSTVAMAAGPVLLNIRRQKKDEIDIPN